MIYLDYAAAAPLDPAVLKKMEPYFSRAFANPASVHSLGQAALKAVDDARWQIAGLLNAKASDLIFTSGATEANNLIIKGLAAASLKRFKKIHIITTAIEHDSIIEPCRYLGEQRRVSITYLPVNRSGLVSVEDVRRALTPETVLLSIGYVNSEIGVVQPIRAIGRMLRTYNRSSLKEWLSASPRRREEKPKRVIFHTDATQAPNYFDCSINHLLVDALSLSGHKLYGPKGIGLLYASAQAAPEPLFHGGHQERNLRSGTVNVSGAVGLAAAYARAVAGRKKNTAHVRQLRDRLIASLQKVGVDFELNTDRAVSSPAYANLRFPGIEGDALLARLDQAGLAASTGSACASGTVSVSRVLKALGLSDEKAHSSLRLTLGAPTTAAEITAAVRRLADAADVFTGDA